ncbi:hypothetical protein BC827DRAFT_1157345 [Russula dissimulans]|nr:hypothetical protein BC827DRAFT_1157345 [Russula dissimulans]
MSQTSAITSRLNYRSILDNALVAYQKKTGKDLRSHPLLSKLRTSNSPDEILTTLREQISGFSQTSSCDKTFTKWLDPTVNVLFAFSATVVAGVTLTYPPAAVIFSAIGVLLSTVKAVRATEAALVSLFERIESFFRRLEAYIAVPSIAGMKDTMVRIMVEVLSILAIVTKEIKQNRAATFLKKLAGRSDIEDALQRLDKLTQEEGWMAAAQGLMATHRVEERVTDALPRYLSRSRENYTTYR